MKVYNENGDSMTVGKEQLETVLDAGWSRTKPESKEDAQAKLEAEEKEAADKLEAEEKAAEEKLKAEEKAAEDKAAEDKKAAAASKPKKIRKTPKK